MYPNYGGGWGTPHEFYTRRPQCSDSNQPMFERRQNRSETNPAVHYPASIPTTSCHSGIQYQTAHAQIYPSSIPVGHQSYGTDYTDASDASTATKDLKPLSNSAEIRTKLIHLKLKLVESPIPKEFDQVVTQLSCTLCGVKSPEPKYMKPHWQSVKHEDEVRYWLLNWYRALRSSDAKWRRRPKAYEYEEDESYCFLCMKPFTGAEIAQNHYDSKQHEKRMLNLLTPMAIAKYNEISVFMCEICNVTCPTSEQLQKHKDSPNHAKKLRALGVMVEIPIPTTVDQPNNEMKFECRICRIKTYTEETLRSHMAGSKHQRKLKKASGEGIFEAEGISGPSNIFSYECKICSVKAETKELMDIHATSKKHKSAVEKRTDPVKKKFIEKVAEQKSSKFRCEICGITANAPGQYRMHMESNKHAKAVARFNVTQNQKQAAPKKRSLDAGPSSEEVASKRAWLEEEEVVVKKEKATEVREEEEEDDDDDGEMKPKAVQMEVHQFLRRYRHLVMQASSCSSSLFEEARSMAGCCGQMFVLHVPGEYVWHTLQRQVNVWRKRIACSCTLVLAEQGDVWRVCIKFGKLTAIAESADMSGARVAAGDSLLNKLQRKYFTLEMPKDYFEKMDINENADDEVEHQDEEEEEEEGVMKIEEEGLLRYDSDDEEDEDEESKLYVVNKENEANKDFEEMVTFYLNDYQANLEDFRDLVFTNFLSYERSSIVDMSAEYGIVAEYRRRKKSKVVLVSKIKTLYKNDPWLFVQVMLQFQNRHFQDWQLVKPDSKHLTCYGDIKYIDEDRLDY